MDYLLEWFRNVGGKTVKPAPASAPQERFRRMTGGDPGASRTSQEALPIVWIDLIMTDKMLKRRANAMERGK